MPRTITLKKPIQVGEGGLVTQLTFRDEVVAGDLRGVNLAHLSGDMFDAAEILKVAGRLCAQPDPVMNRLSLADFQEVSALVVGFIEGGTPTGSAS